MSDVFFQPFRPNVLLVSGSESKIKCKHMLIIFDCCFAGTFRWSAKRRILSISPAIFEGRLRAYLKGKAWQTITSASYDEKALDSFGNRVEDQDNSPFARALFEALEGRAKMGGDGILTAHELINHLREWFIDAGLDSKQTPQLWDMPEHGKGQYIFISPGHPLRVRPNPQLDPDENPYRGLRAYEKSDHQLFFGREDLIQALAEFVIDRPFTVVTGASGTGKSSLVKAGYLPRLALENETSYQTDLNRPNWTVLPVIKPGKNPIQALKAAIKGVAQDIDETLTTANLYQNNDGLVEIVRAIKEGCQSDKVVLVVDQFEELITLRSLDGKKNKERNQFATLLVEAIHHPEDIRLILTIRSDFEGSFAQGLFKKQWIDNRFLVTQMTAADYRDVIELPALQKVLFFENEEMINGLVEEVSAMPGGLPLLSFTLSELYIKYIEDHTRMGRILAEDYLKELGGVVGALQSRADEELKNIGIDNVALIKKIMLRMVAIDGGGIARRQVEHDELSYADPSENERIKDILTNLIDARLLITGEQTDGTLYIEPAHDSLINGWEQLKGWQIESNEYLPLQRRVNQATADWQAEEDEDKKRGLLWNTNTRLPSLAALLPPNVIENPPHQESSSVVFSEALRRYTNRITQIVDRMPIANAPEIEDRWLNKQEIDFVWASVLRRWQNTRRLWGSVATAFVIVFGLSIFAFFLNGQAQQSEATAVAQANRANSEAARALSAENSALVEANRANIQTTRAIAAEEAAVVEANRALSAEATAEAEATRALSAEAAALTAESTAVAERDIAIGQSMVNASRLEGANNTTLALLLAIQANNQYETQYSRTAIEEIYPYTADPILVMRHESEVTAADVGRDRLHILTGSANGNAYIWQRQYDQDPILIATLPHTEPINKVSWNAKIDRILTLTEPITDTEFSRSYQATIWDQRGTKIKTIDDHIHTAYWTPSGNKLMAFTNQNTLQIWRASDGKLITTLPLGGHNPTVKWSSDETMLATLVKDKNNSPIAQIWDIFAEHPISITLGHDGNSANIAWVPNSTNMVVNIAGQLKLFDANGTELSQTTYGRYIYEIKFNHEGSQFLMRGQDTIHVWSIDNNRLISVTEFYDFTEFYGAHWSPDDSKILTYAQNQDVIVWGIEIDQALHRMSTIGTIYAAEWNHDGSRILTRNGSLRGGSSASPTIVELWDATSGQAIGGLLNHNNSIVHAQWLSWFNQILTYDENGVLKIWNKDGTLLRAINHSGPIIDFKSLDYSNLILTASDHEAIIWDFFNTHQLQSFKSYSARSEKVYNMDQSRYVEREKIDFDYVLKNSETDEETAHFRTGCDPEEPQTAIIGFAWHPSKNIALTFGNDGSLKLWDGEDGSELDCIQTSGGLPSAEIIWHPDEIHFIVILRERVQIGQLQSGVLKLNYPTMTLWHLKGKQYKWYPNINRLVSHSRDPFSTDILKVWDTIEGHTIHELTFEGGQQFGFSGDQAGGQIIIFRDSDVLLWQVDKDTPPISLSHFDEHQPEWEFVNIAPIYVKAGWNKHETMIYTHEQHVRLWDANTLNLRHTLTHPESDITGVSLANTQNLIITFDANGLFIVWDTEGGSQLFSATHRSAINGVIWNENEDQFVTYSDDGTAQVWDTTGKLITRLRGDEDPEKNDASFIHGTWNHSRNEISLFTGTRDMVFNNYHREYVYSADFVEAFAQACQRTTRNLTWAEWEQFAAGIPYQITCPEQNHPVDCAVPVDLRPFEHLDRWENQCFIDNR